MSRILWLQPKHGISQKERFLLNVYMQKSGLRLQHCVFSSIYADVPEALVAKKTGTSYKYVPDVTKLEDVRKAMRKIIAVSRPKLVVTNCAAVCMAVGGSGSIEACRGSVYDFEGIPVIVVFDLRQVYGRKDAAWIFANDFGKIARWFEGKQKSQPRFEYTVVRDMQGIADFTNAGKQAACIAVDIETHSGMITCVGFAMLAPNGKLHTWVVPFVGARWNPHWQTEMEEIAAWSAVKAVLGNSTPKVMHNGMYDGSFFVKYGIPVRGFFFDTMLFMWAMFCEARKSLGFTASLTLDYSRYWKDENKGEDGEDNLPKDGPGLERYWRYNALDCYNTLLCLMELLPRFLLPQNRWALQNYVNVFELQFGPALSMTLRGLRIDNNTYMEYGQALMNQHYSALRTIRTMVDMPEFNPGSPDQVAQLIYDVLGATPPKLKGKAAGKLKERSTDAAVLDLIAEQHPLFDKYIQAIYATKEPKNNYSKYFKKSYPTGRFYTGFNAAATETSRWSSRAPVHGIGNNAQNIPAMMRGWLVADPGYVLFENDFSQSDARFVAFESEEPKYMELIESGKDGHCFHAAFFFKHTYEEVLAWHKAKNPYVSHEVTGIRHITKRLVHGTNYDMMGFTMYMNMGRKSVVAAAKALEHADAHLWDTDRLVKFCGWLSKQYNEKLYPGLPKWKRRIVENLVANGAKATTAYGFTRLFFGDVRNDTAIHRTLAAFYGQGDTAGNVNRSLAEIYYASGLLAEGLRLHLQVHDSIVFQLPKEKLHLNQNVLDIMNRHVTINGRSMNVPADSKCGIRWGRNMMGWKPGLSYEEIVAKTQAAPAIV